MIRTNCSTKEMIGQLLKQNTGKSGLDSGNYYGRNWERNKNREFENESPVELDFSYNEISYERNIYHFLVESLEYDRELTESLYEFENSYDHPYANWHDITQDWLKSKGFNSIFRNNTYNGECNLSQSLLYELVTEKEFCPEFYDADFIILQVHGGCDIRGGYTDPVIFRCDIDEFFRFSDGYIQCENGHNWFTDDSVHWYEDGSCGLGAGKQLETYDFMDLDEFYESDDYKMQLERQIIVSENQLTMFKDYNPTIINPVKFPENTILVKDGEGFCPLCAMEGKLVKLFA
jgi:hypothetical protein